MKRMLLAVLLLGLTLPVVSSPPAAYADTTLGGYTASAAAAVVRVQIFEPSLPIPANPQIDATIGFARSNTGLGPSSRALASYLWPGDTLGDGLGTLAGNDNFDYPVKVNSKYPATDVAPAHNTVQLTDGNGMTTSADDTTTQSTVTVLEAGPNLASGLGSGLCALLKQSCPAPAAPKFELPGALSTVATVDTARSQSTVVLKGDTITASARTKVSGLSLLAGLITIDGVDMTAIASSNGEKSTTDGAAKVTGLRVAGQGVDVGNPVDLGGSKTQAPKVPIDLSAVGITVEYLKVTRTASGASGGLSSEGLTITIDASKLSKLLGTNALTGPLGTLLEQIPNAGPLLSGLLKLGSKIVITIGDVRSAATASPPYVVTPLGPTAPVVNPPTGTNTVVPSTPLPAGFPGVINPGAGTPPPLLADVPTTQVAAPFQFPGLAQTPSLLILCGLLAIGLFGWAFKGLGAYFFGADDCLLGASVGVPNLREG